MAIPDDDVEVTAVRSGPVGGQQVGVTHYIIRVKHKHSDMAAECGTERSQHHNRRVALEMLEYGLITAGYLK